MKAILVVDVDDKYLGKEISLIKFTDGNAIYCSEELKPMPQRKEFDNQIPYEKGGWNDCLDEIVGEK